MLRLLSSDECIKEICKFSITLENIFVKQKENIPSNSHGVELIPPGIVLELFLAHVLLKLIIKSLLYTWKLNWNLPIELPFDFISFPTRQRFIHN